MVRVAQATQETQVVFITNTPQLSHATEIIDELSTQFPEIVSFMQNINSGRQSLIWGDQTVKLRGHYTMKLEKRYRSLQTHELWTPILEWEQSVYP